MQRITKKTVLLFFFIWSICLPTIAQLTGTVSISVAEDASSKDVIAAKEVRRYLYLRTGTIIEIKSQNWNSIPANENVILIGSSISTSIQQFFTAKGIAVPSLGVEDFYLKTITDGTRKICLITGYDETATLRGAYKLMEKFGVRYSHVEDIVAEGIITLDFPVIDKVYTPNFAFRGMLPYHSWNPEGPEYWSADFYKYFLNQQFKMGQNIMGLVHDYTVSDTRAWVWPPALQDNKENKQYEIAVNTPAAGAAQVFSGPILASPRRLEARKITDLAQRDAYMRQANLSFLKDVYGYAKKIGVKTIYGSEHSGDLNYYLQFFNDLKTFNPSYYWLMTKEYWTWGFGTVNDQDFKWIMEGIDHARNAKVQTGAAFGLGVTGWRLGPPLSPGGQTVIADAVPNDFVISCQTPNVGQDPIQPEWAQISQTNKWIIPWMEDDFSLGNQQLWVDRTIKNAADGKSYGSNGLLGVHWSTKRVTPQSMVLAQLGWDATITKKSFWDDFCLIHFGSEVAGAASTIFQNQDGNMARVTNWINNWPGTLVSGTHDFSYVDQFAALRPGVVGASNLERFDYYLNQFKFNRALGALGNNQNSIPLYHDVMNALLPATYTSGEIGNIVTLARQIGSNVDANYTGTPHMVVLTPRSNLLPSEDLSLDIYFVESGLPQKVELFWKAIGDTAFTTVQAVKQTNSHHFKVAIPASTLAGNDFEYYIKGTTSSGAVELAPKSAPTRSFTVVVMSNLLAEDSSNVFEAENNFTVVADVGTIGNVVPASSIACSNKKYLAMPDAGDEARISFTVPTAGDYNVFIRLKSGNTSGATSLIGSYEVKVNNAPKTTTLVQGSVSAIIDVDSYYGTIKTQSVALNAGINYVSLKALSNGLRVDYVQAFLVADTEAPTAPTSLIASDIITTKFQLSWMASTDNVGVTSYDVFKGGVFVGSSPTNNSVISGLTSNTTYLFTVVAKDAAGNISAASSALSVTTKDFDVVMEKTSVAPLIDGIKEASWNGLINPVANVTVGSVSSATDLSATWAASWDDTDLYIFVDVQDDVIKVDSDNSWWEDDRIEIFIDAGFTRTSTFGPKQYQYYIRPGETTLKEVKLNAVLNTQVAYKVVSGGYQIEIKIPFATLGITPSLNQKMGFDVQVGDDDDGGGIDGKMSWFAIEDNSWQVPANFGTALLISNLGVVNVTGLTVQPTSVSLPKIGDRYQLSAVLAPANASDKRVTWSSNNSSLVTVSSSGNVKAIRQGIAIITATSIDGGFIGSATVEVLTNAVDAEIPMATLPVILDGLRDASYGGLNHEVKNVISGAVGSPADFSGSWSSQWGIDALYFHVRVVDDILGVSATNRWENDGVEIYIDANHNKFPSYGANDFSFTYVRNSLTIIDAGRNSTPAGIQFVKLDNDIGYTIEFKIPYTTLGIDAPVVGHLMGLDVHLIDNDGGNSRQGKMAWFNTVDNSWISPAVFATIRLVDENVLPLNLLKFGATLQQGNVQLSWQTTSEKNIAGFDVEHTIGFGQFSSIGNVAPVGGFTNINNYQYLHRKPFAGLNSYRLKIMDVDGAFKYSSVVNIKVDGTDNKLNVYPNPSKSNWLVVDLGKVVPKQLGYTIYDQLGRLVQQGWLQNQVQTLNISNLRAGLYNLKISDGQVIKIIKQ